MRGLSQGISEWDAPAGQKPTTVCWSQGSIEELLPVSYAGDPDDENAARIEAGAGCPAILQTVEAAAHMPRSTRASS